jgi:hypothetical protein
MELWRRAWKGARSNRDNQDGPRDVEDPSLSSLIYQGGPSFSGVLLPSPLGRAQRNVVYILLLRVVVFQMHYSMIESSRFSPRSAVVIPLFQSTGLSTSWNTCPSVLRRVLGSSAYAASLEQAKGRPVFPASPVFDS